MPGRMICTEEISLSSARRSLAGRPKQKRFPTHQLTECVHSPEKSRSDPILNISFLRG